MPTFNEIRVLPGSGATTFEYTTPSGGTPLVTGNTAASNGHTVLAPSSPIVILRGIFGTFEIATIGNAIVDSQSGVSGSGMVGSPTVSIVG